MLSLLCEYILALASRRTCQCGTGAASPMMERGWSGAELARDGLHCTVKQLLTSSRWEIGRQASAQYPRLLPLHRRRRARSHRLHPPARAPAASCVLLGYATASQALAIDCTRKRTFCLAAAWRSFFQRFSESPKTRELPSATG